MGDLNFRRFEARDLPTLQAIRAAAFAPIFAAFREMTGPEIASAFDSADAEQAALLTGLAEEPEGTELWVAERGGEIAGFGAVIFHRTRGVGEIGLNAVDPAHAGRGIGTALYEHLLERMRAEGMSIAEVGTGGDPSHAAARQAYAKAGFTKAIPSVALYRPL